MHVIATAGHVDHGKSTLVKALTGREPDRLPAERARGLSIELGYVWTTLPSIGDLAFVDVPGHERFVPTMLAGVGPVPAVLLVVAADDPWMPQAAEHLAALDAWGVRHAVVAVTRSDLADPAPMEARTRQEVERTSLAGAPVVAVSARTGAGLDELRACLTEMVGSLPVPDPDADVRLWVDRCFTVRGAGTVVTGTLPAGTVRVGDALSSGTATLRVRGIQSLGLPVDQASGVARVALNVAGADRAELDRHSVLVAPGAWRFAGAIDVRLRSTTGRHDQAPARRLVLHVGAVSVPVYLRPLGDDLARLTLDRPLPLRVGDSALLRDPGSRRIWGVTVLDPAPPPLGRRGAARERATVLAAAGRPADLSSEVARRGIVHVDLLRQIGVPVGPSERASATSDGWLVADREVQRLRPLLEDLVRRHEADEPLEPGLPVATVAERLQLPSTELVGLLVDPPLRVAHGRVTATVAGPPVERLAPAVDAAVTAVETELAAAPFVAPTADRLRELRLDPRATALAVRAGRLLHLGDGIVLRTGSDDLAVRLLRDLAQPFTTSEARIRLGTSRRVVLPLLQLLDRQGRTRRLADDRRSVVSVERRSRA
ncbi:MAG: selenocysteine-specific elongation factor [Nocardioidaceae bacterium]|nr:selenocysteine-specific elongation factor [Nocardioidaceae bacterium]